MPGGMQRKAQRQQGHATGDQPQRDVGRQPVFDDQRHGARQHQQEGQAAEAMVMMMAVTVMAMMVVAMTMMKMVVMSAMTARLALVEGKFAANLRLVFAHGYPFEQGSQNWPRPRHHHNIIKYQS